MEDAKTNLTASCFLMFLNCFHTLFPHVLLLSSTARKINMLSDFTLQKQCDLCVLSLKSTNHWSIKKHMQCKYVGQDTASCLLQLCLSSGDKVLAVKTEGLQMPDMWCLFPLQDSLVTRKPHCIPKRIKYVKNNREITLTCFST